METKTYVQKAKGLSLRFLITAAIFIASLLLFWMIADEMVLENENGFDQIVFQHLLFMTSPATTRVMTVITFFGSTYFLLPAYLLLIGYFLMYRKTRRLSLDIASIGITSTIILFTLKDLFHRHRPYDPLVVQVNGFSFPSGHSFCSFTFFGLLIYIAWHFPINRPLRWSLSVFFFLFACAIAFSRVYLHVHYASDVVAGFFLCVVWLSLSFWLMHKFEKKWQ